MIVSSRLALKTKGNTQIIDITANVTSIVEDSKIKNGIITIFVPGSTAAVTSIEYESGVLKDLEEALEKVASAHKHYHHDARWGDGNGYAHVRAALLKGSFTVPIIDRHLTLGTWQQIVFIDFDNRPRSRELIIQIIGE